MARIKKEPVGYRLFQGVNAIVMLFMVCVTLYPFLFVIAQSLSSSAAIYAGKVTIFPVETNLLAYTTVVRNPDFYLSYRNTLFYVVLGTAISLVLSCMLAYPLSKPRLKIQRFLTPFIIFRLPPSLPKFHPVLAHRLFYIHYGQFWKNVCNIHSQF